MRVQFKGPEGAYWVGKDFKVASVESSKISALADLQVATGWTMPEVMKNAELEMVGVRMLAFLTLRNAGQFVSWVEVGDVAITDIEFTAEPGDEQSVAPDPLEAPTDSSRGDEPATEAAPSPSKPKKPGSATQSGRAK